MAFPSLLEPSGLLMAGLSPSPYEENTMGASNDPDAVISNVPFHFDPLSKSTESPDEKV